MARLFQDFITADRAYRQRLCCSERCEYLDAGSKHLRKGFEDRGGNRATGRNDAPQRRQLDTVRDTEIADALEQRRGSEQVCHAEVLDGLYDLTRIDVSRARGIHIGDYCRHAQSRSK